LKFSLSSAESASTTLPFGSRSTIDPLALKVPDFML